MIDLFISKIWSKVEKHIRVCFFSAFICGIFAHIYALTNHLYNYDELWHTPTGFGTGVQMGRWGLSILAWITKVLFKDVYTIPTVNGLITIIMYSLVACIVVKILNINECYFAGIVGALITTFPSVVSRMFYMFTTHYYAIGEVLVALGVLVLYKSKKRIVDVLVAIALLVLGTSIYQTAYITAVCIVVTALLADLIGKEYSLIDIIKKCLSYVSFLALSMVTYLVSNKIALAVTGLKMDAHGENYDTMGHMTVEQLLGGIIHCYKSFMKAGFIDVYSMNPNRIVRVAFAISVVIISYLGLRVFFSKHSIYQKIFILLIICILPVAVNLVYIMGASSGVMYSIMTFDMVFMLIIPIVILESLEKVDGVTIAFAKVDKALNCVTAIVLGLSVFSYIWFANGNFLAVQYTNSHDNTYYQTLMTQIKSVDGYNADMPIAMIGKPQPDSSFMRQDMIGNTFNIGGKASTNINAYSSWNIMTRVLGYDPMVRDTDEDETYFRGLGEVDKMPCYPNAGSIKIIDNTIVIKFQEVDELNNN